MRNSVSSRLTCGFDRLSFTNALLWAGLILLLSVVLSGTPYAEEVVLITVLAAATSLTLSRARTGSDSAERR